METKELKEKLFMARPNVYDDLSEEARAEMNDFSAKYMRFIDIAKTEREAVIEGIKMLEEAGFKSFEFGDKIEKGGKYYYNNRGKALIAFAIGSENVEKGIRISVAHVDSPRIDLKQCPVYEDGNMGFFKTHYYGGIKKYQWTAIPLALHGVVYRADGSVVDVCIGEDENDPVFYINDLLPHLAKNQMGKTLAEGITGEGLNILIGSEPYSDKDADQRIKLHMLKLLNEKYGITEADFLSAELTCVPADKAREIGFDRSLIGGYGHDDRVCAYPALRALLDHPNPEHTLMTILADKEEIGSNGNTGMECIIFVDIITEIANALGANERLVRRNSKCLSADVNAAYDPNFAEVYERNNSSFINRGVVLTKYTGSRGKGGTSDASAEFVGFVRSIFDREGVIWQSGELGKVDQGGGGTVAMYVAEKDIDVVDLGVPVISMHAPWEVIAKADLYMTYKAFSVFNK
ncbi:MAG: aminopeptidase [Clostridia bacterium]|nr:aminopeptidase [Clostridia bacterium]